ncbi:MAG: hypothetical protein PHD49_02270 [Candidatus Shapirobacteria bacterium]|nr:hypothetical protein [Candidatus Shapirobacteria bacterium]
MTIILKKRPFIVKKFNHQKTTKITNGRILFNESAVVLKFGEKTLISVVQKERNKIPFKTTFNTNIFSFSSFVVTNLTY